VYAPAREAELLDRLTRLRTGELRPEDLRAIYREILSASRDLQRPLRIAFLGPKATYGHQAALQRFGAAAQPHVEAALRAAEQHTVFLKVLGAWPIGAGDAKL